MSQPILLLNCGSSSIKYQLLDPEVEQPLAVGLVQRIGQGRSTLDHTTGAEKFHTEQDYADHTEAVAAVVANFAEHGPSLADVRAVGHRTVHGGIRFNQSVLITQPVIDRLKELSELAPLHNPPSVAGIEAAMEILPGVPHVAIFDTAFFSTLPPEAYTYAINREVTAEHKIRRFGFHGTSHSYVSKRTAEFVGRPIEELKIIVAHLGNGASISAIKGGVAIDTSMGLTPLEGLVMGTRSGDIDPGMPKFLAGKGMTLDQIDTMLNRESGMGGLCGHTDMRDVVAAIDDGDEQASLALDIYVHRLIGYIGSYIAVLGGLDFLTFTAGVGENSAPVRERVLKRLSEIGFTLDEAANNSPSREAREITRPDSRYRVLVIPTNEEQEMAEETLKVLARS